MIGLSFFRDGLRITSVRRIATQTDLAGPWGSISVKRHVGAKCRTECQVGTGALATHDDVDERGFASRWALEIVLGVMGVTRLSRRWAGMEMDVVGENRVVEYRLSCSALSRRSTQWGPAMSMATYPT
jgi:hypothetical protein